MGLNIKNEEVVAKARKVSEREGVSMTQAINRALDVYSSLQDEKDRKRETQIDHLLAQFYREPTPPSSEHGQYSDYLYDGR